MTDFDPTKNRIPFVLLTSEEQAALKAWPHGWKMFDGGSWADIPDPAWCLYMTYRGKPAPVVETYFCNVYNPSCSYGWHDSYDDAVRMADAQHIGIVRIEIVDGKLEDVRVVEGDET